MSKRTAIWVDHAKALVAIEQDGHWIEFGVKSGVEKARKSTGGHHGRQPRDQHQGSSQQAVGERRTHQLNAYYRYLTTLAAGSATILILGPGLAKKELASEIKATKSLTKAEVGALTADKMTMSQVRKALEAGMKKGR